MARRRWSKVLGPGVAERDEAPLGDEALLVRGGQFRIAHVRTRAEACLRRLGFAGVSVAHAPGGRLEDLCEMSPRLLDYRECAITTAGRVRARFGLAPTGAHPHFSIVLPDTSAETVRALRDLFELGVPVPRLEGEG